MYSPARTYESKITFDEHDLGRLRRPSAKYLEKRSYVSALSDRAGPHQRGRTMLRSVFRLFDPSGRIRRKCNDSLQRLIVPAPSTNGSTVERVSNDHATINQALAAISQFSRISPTPAASAPQAPVGDDQGGLRATRSASYRP